MSNIHGTTCEEEYSWTIFFGFLKVDSYVFQKEEVGEEDAEEEKICWKQEKMHLSLRIAAHILY